MLKKKKKKKKKKHLKKNDIKNNLKEIRKKYIVIVGQKADVRPRPVVSRSPHWGFTVTGTEMYFCLLPPLTPKKEICLLGGVPGSQVKPGRDGALERSFSPMFFRNNGFLSKYCTNPRV